MKYEIPPLTRVTLKNVVAIALGFALLVAFAPNAARYFEGKITDNRIHKNDDLLSSASQDVTAIIPQDRLGDWQPGITVGVPGGIDSYDAARTNIINVTQAPYYASRSTQTTTGSMSSGSSQLTVADPIDFQVGQYIIVRGAFAYDWDTAHTPRDLTTQITAINGTIFTVADAATLSASSVLVAHDDGRAIDIAIAEAPDNSVIYMPAGTYSFRSGIYIKRNNITLRGDGDSTIILLNDNQIGAISVGVASALSTDATFNISGTVSKGATTVTVPSTANLSSYWHGAVGMNAEISIRNDYKGVTNGDYTQILPVIDVKNQDRVRRQIVNVTAVSSTTISFYPPIAFDLPANLVPQIAFQALPYPTGYFVGLEDFKINITTPPPSGSAQFGIREWQTFGSWIKGVTVLNSHNYHFWFNNCLQCELRHSIFAYRSSVGTNGAGILADVDSNCLFEDNIGYKSFPHVEVNQGSTNNVFGYNYFSDSRTFGFYSGHSITTNHGAHNSYNLYEGNIAPHLISDGYFGGESELTVFRNWITGVEPHYLEYFAPRLNLPRYNYTAALERFTRSASIVGNVFGNPTEYEYVGRSFSMGNPNFGGGADNGGTARLSQGIPWSDWTTFLSSSEGVGVGVGGFQEIDNDVASTTILWANYEYGLGSAGYNASDIPANVPVPSTHSLPNSLYLSAAPSWWASSGLSWPTIGVGSGGNPITGSIPAKVRFDAMNQTQNSLLDTTAPVISSVAVSSIAQTSAVITWQTNEYADNIVSYGTASGIYTDTTYPNPLNSFYNRSATLNGLNPSTTYYFVAVSTDPDGNFATSSENSFTTASAGADTSAPVISGALPSGAQAANTTSATISVSTNENATCKFSTSSGVAFASMSNTFSTTGGASHSSSVTGLTNGSSYTYYVRCQDGSSNTNTSDATISFSVADVVADTTAPVRSNKSPASTPSLPSNTTSTTIALTTDEAATCKYGTTAGVTYGSIANTFTTTGSTAHSATVSGLESNTVYNYYVRCSDTSSNVNSTDYTITFTVSPIEIDNGNVTPVAPTVTTASTASVITGTTATLSGTITATGTAAITTRGFQYGVSSYTATSTESGSWTTAGAYSSSISGLTCNTTYLFRAYAQSSAGIAFGAPVNFTTNACTTNTTTTTTTSSGSSGGTRSSGGGNITPPSNLASTTIAIGIKADPGTVAPGGATTITWDTKNTSYCYAPWTVSTAVKGTQIVKPTVTTTYTLTCFSLDKKTYKQLPLVVNVTANGKVAPVTTTSATCTTLTRVMSLGSQDTKTNTNVAKLQKFLNSQGYTKFKPTGYFGTLTRAAVVDFQKKNKLPSTGIAGAMTAARVKAISCK